MPSEPRPIELDLTPPGEVVEFGAPPTTRRRWGLAGFGRGLAADRRTVPLAVALGAVAVFASLVSEWQTTTVAGGLFGGTVGSRQLVTDLADLGTLGAGYLVGLLLLAAAAVLTLFGPAAGRAYARLAGLSVGGTLLALLAALTVSLGDQSRVVSRVYSLDPDGSRFTLGYGRALWCAFAGVALTLLALYLSGRNSAEPADGLTGDPATGRYGAEPADGSDDRSWRRPVQRVAGPADDQPLDLTVGPSESFTGPPDQPGRSPR